MNRITRRAGAVGLALCATVVLSSAPALAGPATEQMTEPVSEPATGPTIGSQPPPLPVGFIDVCLLPFTNVIVGTPEADVLEGTGQNDLILGLGGDDQLYGRGGNDSLYGGSGRDLLMGDAGDDCIVGGPDRDTSLRYTFVDHGTDDVRDVEARYEY
jgi:hypothetical protein